LNKDLNIKVKNNNLFYYLGTILIILILALFFALGKKKGFKNKKD